MQRRLKLKPHGREHKVQEAMLHFQSLFEHNSDGVYSLDKNGLFTSFNPAAEAISGYHAEEVLGISFTSIIHPKWLESTDLGFHHAVSGESSHFDTQIIHKTGRIIHLHVVNVPVIINGEVSTILGIAQDITEKKRTQFMLREQNRILKGIASGVDLPQLLHELTLSVEQQSEGAFCSILLLDKQTNRLYHGASPNLPQSYVQAIDDLPVQEGSGSCGTAAFRREVVIVTDIATNPLCTKYRDITLQHGLRSCWSQPIVSSSQTTLGTFAMYYKESRRPTTHDLNLMETYAYLAGLAIERHQSELSIQHMAFHDDLTGLPNRRWIHDYLNHEFTANPSNSQIVSVSYLDLDNFKAVNDSLGHAHGDTLLKVVSKRLVDSIGARGMVARTGGDEFLVVLPNLTSVEQVATIISDALEATRQPIYIQNNSLRVTASIGISLYPSHGETVESLLKCADVAMYQAKKRGGNRALFYTTGISHSTVEDLQFSRNLSEALDRKEFELHFQPRYSIKRRRVIGAEALLRWNHPAYGIVSPARFIPLLEATGDIVRVGEWVLRVACEQAKKWNENGLQDFRISVNISPRQFQTGNLSNTIGKILRDTGLRPELLEIEITETTLVQDQAATVSDLRKLKELGVFISIDDFGTGYSSLSYLLRFRVDSLKIDQSFIRGVVEDKDSAIISASVIALAHNLQMGVVAEGVETEEQLSALAERDCDEIQGFLLSEPVSAQDFHAVVTQMNSTT